MHAKLRIWQSDLLLYLIGSGLHQIDVQKQADVQAFLMQDLL